VTAVPGQTPTFPVIGEVVHVTAVPARAAKPDAEPSDDGDVAANPGEGLYRSAAKDMVTARASRETVSVRMRLLIIYS
jgi:hypothetical protein